MNGVGPVLGRAALFCGEVEARFRRAPAFAQFYSESTAGVLGVKDFAGVFWAARGRGAVSGLRNLHRGQEVERRSGLSYVST